LVPSSHSKHVLKAWIPALIWLAVIAVESTDLLSSNNTSQLLFPLLHFLLRMDLVRFLVFHEHLRKVGHFVGYFTLSVLLFRAWKATLPLAQVKAWSAQWARTAFFMTAMVATFDEWHQTYLASRTGNVGDVILDSSAAFAAQIVIWIFLKRRQPRSREHSGKTIA
jgi:VanZ family protein